MTFKEKSKAFITSETYSQVNLRNRKPENEQPYNYERN